MSIMRTTSALCAAFVLGMACVLSACGGGNDAPVAIITVTPDAATPGITMSLSGADSFDPDGTISVYGWSQSGGQVVALSAETGETVSFTVPNATTTLIFDLVVTDDQGKPSLPATIQISVTATSTPVNPGSNAPLAIFVSGSAGSDAADRDGSSAEPVASIAHGIELARQGGGGAVYVYEGTYEESISIPSGVELIGCVAGTDVEGKPIFAASPAGTVIKAPAGAEQAVSITQAAGVRVSCMTVVGGTTPNIARAIAIDGSSDVTLDKLSISTPGAASGICRDVDAVDSSAIAVDNVAFRSRGHCSDYTGITMENVSASSIASSAGDVVFTMASGGSEKGYKGIELLGGHDIVMDGVVLQGDGGSLPADAFFTGVVARDVTGLVIRNNSIEARGGMQSTGVSLRCSNVVFGAAVEANDIVLTEATFKSSGVRITCAQDASSFDIERNALSLTPADNQAAKMLGIDVNGSLMQVDLSIVNNVVMMPTATNDAASKTGVALSKLAPASSVDMRHNTLLVTGNAGALYALSSDSANVRFRNINNIFLIYGAGATNAVYSLPSGCETSYCAQVIIANLVNRNFGAFDLPLAYYYDTAQTVAQAVANECMQVAPPAQCTAHEVSRKDNIFQSNMKPTYFDFADGTLDALHQALAIDKGFATAGVTVDIDTNARNDGMPDIGAHEY
jgi:hypothetical protein